MKHDKSWIIQKGEAIQILYPALALLQIQMDLFFFESILLHAFFQFQKSLMDVC